MSEQELEESEEQRVFRLGGTAAVLAYEREKAGVLQPGEPTWQDYCCEETSE